ncbi:hypothetical protein [Nonomuraea sp. PA05]|uniref:hypothetical protein n=1 Tax=Nonomuraea sp. PA05 TaxID=2604466 RepID=UPI0016529BF2|nr:hypothetical protein [Nonomuraea sp. PA05]
MKLGVDAGRAYVKVAEVTADGPALITRLATGERYMGACSHVVLAAAKGLDVVERARRAGFRDVITISPPRAVLLHLAAERQIRPGRRVLLCDAGAASIDLYLCQLGASVIYVLDSEHGACLDLAAEMDGLRGAGVFDRRLDHRDDDAEERLRSLLAWVVRDSQWGDTPAFRDLCVTTAQVHELVQRVAELAARSAARMRDRRPDFGSRSGDLLVPLGGANVFALVRDAVRDALGLSEGAVLPLAHDESLNAAAYGAARVAAGQPAYDHYPFLLSVAAHRHEGIGSHGEWLELAAPDQVRLGGGTYYAQDRMESVLVEAGHRLLVAVGDPATGRHLECALDVPPGRYHLGVRVGQSGHGDLVLTPAGGGAVESSVPLGTLPI